MSGSERHREILVELHKTYIKKNHDYGDSFGALYRMFGQITALVRIWDKVNRLTSLYFKKGKVEDESIKDTLYDLANYAILTIMEIEKRENNVMAETDDL